MWWAPFDIQRSRLVVRRLHFVKVGKTYYCLVFSTNLRIISSENYFMEGKTNLEHKCKHKCFIHKLSTNCMGRWFLTINMLISSIFKLLFLHMIFLERIFGNKNIDHCIAKWIWSFLVSCLSTSPFKELLIYSLNIFAIIEWFAFTCFFNVVIPIIVMYKIRPFFAWVLELENKIGLM